METILAIATCSPQLEVALCPAEGVGSCSVVRLSGGSPRSTLLLAAVDLLLEDAGLGPERVEVVVVSRGPGSFTGIRAALATAAGIAAGSGARVLAYGSLLAQAARTEVRGLVWAAQPGRRGELYAVPFAVAPGTIPRAAAELEILSVERTSRVGPWIAPESVDLGRGERAPAARTTAEALLQLAARGAPGEPVEPLYVEGPPIHGPGQ